MAKGISDLTYTLKACLYAGETFKNKEFICQDQVVNLIQQVCEKYATRLPEKIKGQFQQILMLALAIINTMIAPTNLKKDFTKEQGR